jgi:hypothetical protein
MFPVGITICKMLPLEPLKILGERGENQNGRRVPLWTYRRHKTGWEKSLGTALSLEVTQADHGRVSVGRRASVFL